MGWYYEVRDWIQSSLKHYHVSSLFQKHVSSISTVFEVVTNCGEKFFFKASSSKWLTDEAAATQALGGVMDSDFGAAVGVDLVRNWMLMRNYGEDMTYHLRHMLEYSNSQEKERNLAVMHDVLQQWGEIKMRSVQNVTMLIQAGVPKAEKEWLSRKIVEIVDSSFWHEAQCAGDERKGLPKLGPEERKQKLISLIAIFGRKSKVTKFHLHWCTEIYCPTMFVRKMNEVDTCFTTLGVSR